MDKLVFELLNGFTGTNEAVDTVIVFLSIFLWYWVMVSVLAFAAVYFYQKFRDRFGSHLKLILFAAFSAFVARFVFTELIRFFYNRPRPFEVLENIHQLVNHTGGGSFPSGHAALSFAVVTAVSFFYPKTSILFFLAAVLIGAGRVAAGVHWPSDILGGAIVGIGTAWLVRWVWRRFLDRN